MNKTVLELDLVGYSSSAWNLEENLGVEAVARLNKQIQRFVSQGLDAVGVSQGEAVMATTGDGAILVFDRAEDAHHFALAVHDATRVHNSDKTEPSAMRLFRMGAATGELTMEPRDGGGYDISGIVIARAVRLEAAAQAGELLIDAKTFDSLSQSLRALYGAEERVRGKRNEEFSGRRCVMNSEVTEQLNTKTEPTPKKLSGSRRVILDLFEKLDPSNLERLIFLLDIPIKQRPPVTMDTQERENHILQSISSAQDGLRNLESELRFLVEKQNAETSANP